MGMENVGRKLTLDLSTGESIEGWMFAEDQLAVYVTLDAEGNHIRYIPSGLVSRTFYHDEEDHQPNAERQAELDAIRILEKSLDKSFEQAFYRIDQNRIRLVGQRLIENRRELEKMRHEEYLELGTLMPVVRIVDAHKELLDELVRSNVDEQLIKHGVVIRRGIYPSTIPQIDGYISTSYDLNQLILLAREQDRLSETALGRMYLEKISAEDILEFEERRQKAQSKPEKTDDPAQKMAKRMKKVAAGIKIVVGGCLAVTNITVGSLGGVIAGLPTLGLGTVPVAVGVATSTYTGLNAASDGLKDLATAIEPAKN